MTGAGSDDRIGEAMSMSQPMLIRRIGQDEGRQSDDLAVEEPLLVRVNGVDLTTTMRTPGHDFELAAGLTLAEGLLGPAEIHRIGYETVRADNPQAVMAVDVVALTTDPPDVVPQTRLAVTSTACGLCGHADLDGMINDLGPVGTVEPWADDVIVQLPSLGLAGLHLFRRTGATHGAALVDRTGGLIVAREDIGRHNAVDKVVGNAVLHGIIEASSSGPAVGADQLALVVSGRASFEIVQKAWAAGVGTVVAVSAPSALAVTSARRAGMVLAGFVADGRANLYSPAP